MSFRIQHRGEDGMYVSTPLNFSYLEKAIEHTYGDCQIVELPSCTVVWRSSDAIDT